MLNRRQHASSSVVRDIEYGKALRILASPATWVLFALFFIASTPFELGQSGVAYLLKACAISAMVAYAVLVSGAQAGRLSVVAIAVVAVLFITNLFGWTDRVLLAIVAIVAGALLGQLRGGKWDDEFQIILFLYLLVHFVGLMLAALIFYSAGQAIDLHTFMFPHESRAEAYKIIGRISGFHTEPGTYSQWMIMTLYLFALTQNRLFSKWTAVIALSVVFTVSLWGVLALGVVAAAFAIEALTSSRGKGPRDLRLPGFILLIGIVLVFALSIPKDVLEEGLQFLELKGGMTTDSSLDKLYAWEFMNQEFWNVAFLGRPFDPGFCPECISPQDAGIGMTGTYYLGFLLFASLIVMVVRSVYAYWGLAFVAPIALILVWKAHIYEPLLWVIIGFVLTGPVGQRRRVP